MAPIMGVEALAFLKERFEKDLKHFQVYDTYTPDFNKTLLTSKFYSKYEGQNSNDVADPVLMEKIKKVKYDTPRERHPWPSTENQCYGWFHEPLVPIEFDDNRYYHPHKSSDFIKHELQLKMDESALPKVKFAGIPFKVQ
ncbi:uncharacterized protein LOC123015862 [Tribolium madens]|uniref:uncharacterized protein LOC123015862 n=1 Tax=Tribolium madens TaxID=41895 RepID=UPI001CF74E2A|nr:uncharacterized protein LOC123015862 [Tribolium madens]